MQSDFALLSAISRNSGDAFSVFPLLFSIEKLGSNLKREIIAKNRFLKGF